MIISYIISVSLLIFQLSILLYRMFLPEACLNFRFQEAAELPLGVSNLPVQGVQATADFVFDFYCN